MKKIIAVCGSNEGDENLTPEILKIAERTGYLIAERGGILVCGGLGGIMEAAARGAKKAKGTTVGILPWKKDRANKYIDIPIETNLGFYRNSIIINSADSIIAICGRWGTLNEVSMGVALGKPVILISTSGGISELFSKNEIISKFKRKPLVAETPEKAVELAFNIF